MKYKQAISRLIQIIMILKNNKEIRHNELYKLTYAVLTLTSCQTSANLSWGEYQIPVTKVNQSSITITQNRAYRNHEYQPGSKLPEYHHAYTNTDSCKDIFCLNISQFLKHKFKCYSRRILTPYLTWYLTPNITRFPSYFRIAIPVWVIRRSLLHVKLITRKFNSTYLNKLKKFKAYKKFIKNL